MRLPSVSSQGSVLSFAQNDKYLKSLGKDKVVGSGVGEDIEGQVSNPNFLSPLLRMTDFLREQKFIGQ
jgi:hypothetical protein